MTKVISQAVQQHAAELGVQQDRERSKPFMSRSACGRVLGVLRSGRAV